MKTFINAFTLLLVLLVLTTFGQDKSYLDNAHLPANLSLDKTRKASYQIITDYLNYDLKANFLDKKRIVGGYTTGLGNDSIRWNNVTIANSKELSSSFPAGEKQIFMENFQYVQNPEVLLPEFFQKIPFADYMVKNLIWDVLGFYAIAYASWDSLTLNHEYHSKELNSEINLAATGTFENKDVILNWIGTSKVNGVLCAIIKYAAFNNPLRVKWENFVMDGRSHYWGEIYVSLDDKQIEYASLSEDVITDIQLNNQPQHITGYTVRKITVTKL